MAKTLRIVLFLFALFCSHILVGQQHTFLHFSSKDGLPQSQVNDIIQDNDGFLWIATNGGISRFDGKYFENFSTLNGLKENEIRNLDIDDKGNIWIADNRGLTSYNGNKFSHYNYEKTIPSISQIYCDKDTVWIGSGDGLLKFYDGEYLLFRFSNQIDWRITSIHRNGDDLWIFTRKAGFIFNGTNSIPSKTENLPWIVSVKSWGDKNYLVSDVSGLFEGFDESKQILNNENGLTDLIIRDMAIEKNGSIWLASSRNLMNWDGKSTKIITEKNGLGYNDISCIFVDSDNVLWLGSDGNGLYKYTGDLINTYTTKEGLNSNLIMGITENNKAMYTLSYTKGLSKITKDTIINIPYNDELIIGNAWCIESSGNDIWSGLSRGLAKTNDKGTKVYTQADGLLDNYIISLFWDEEEKILYIGSRNGYTELKNGEFSTHSFSNGFPLNRVRYITKDDNGSLWFAGLNGVAKYDGEEYTVYTDSNGLPANSTYNIAFFDNKTWIGSNDGLSYIQDGEITLYSLSNSPKDLYINILLYDERGRLWIGTNNGIYALRNDSISEYKIDYYGIQNGLMGLETNFNASYVDNNGNVFFGFEQGLVRFDRNELNIIENQSPPKLKLTKLQVYLKDVNWGARGDSLVKGSNLPVDLKLKPKENYLTFNFAGINMKNPEDVRYRFMLEGAEGELSTNWSNPSKANFATFSNLASGPYTFKVQATNGNASWPEDFSSYSFIIKTPYYSTWWFRSLVALFIIATVYFIYSYRIRTIRQEQENLRLRSQSKMLALEQQTLNANMNRHFVFNALNSIQYYLNKEDKKSANRYLSRFAKLIRKNLDSSQSKQTTLHEEIDRMVLYMELEQMRFAHKFDFAFNVDKGINTREINIPSMLFQPYLENSIWHGILPMDIHGQIKVDISNVEDDCISIKIFDNGIGIDTSMKHKIENQDHISVGMDITKNRLALFEQLSNKKASVKGPYEILEGGKTIGTQVELILPRLNGNS